jgi:hypothetical protein
MRPGWNPGSLAAAAGQQRSGKPDTDQIRGCGSERAAARAGGSREVQPGACGGYHRDYREPERGNVRAGRGGGIKRRGQRGQFVFGCLLIDRGPT